MPKVEYTKAKGLVQSTGSGFALNQIETMNGSHLAVSQGTTFVELQTAHQVTLPPASGANTGDIIILALSATAAAVLKGDDAAHGDTTLGTIGDGAICVFNGTQWVCSIVDQ